MGVVVQFSYASWAALFPQFGNLTTAQITGPVLTVAEQYCRNDGGGPVNNAGVQAQLLNLMVAHVAQLLFGSSAQPVSPLVGRISSATEGSVSVGIDFPVTPSNAWFVQTQYGAAYWQLALPFRLGRYAPKTTQQRQFGSGPYGGGWGW